MKQTVLKYVLLFSVLLLTGSLNLYAQKTTAYDQLRSVNAEWKNQPDIDAALLNMPAKYLAEQQLIQFHLQQTEQLLRKRSTNELTAAQKKNRLANLDVLHSYWQKGIFPVNDMHDGRQPYFIDKLNTYCAVGYLMQQSGADKMARDINRSQNYNYLIDIAHPDLMDWAYNSGLSLDELALIQPAYASDMPCVITELHYNNTGPDVNEYIEVRQHNFMPFMAFQTIRFYDHLGVLYKTLLKDDMQFIASAYSYYYLFPANESLADSGRIEFIRSTAQISSEFHYNSSGITYIDHSPLGQTKYFSVIEDENIPVGSSLSFCGRYTSSSGPTTWSASIIPATIGIMNPCVILPLTLSSFNYATHSKTVELKWQTSTESNTDQFIVERSYDGINFTPIGKVKAAGTSNTIKQYNLVDNDPGYLNHYRLKQVNMDGSFTYSQILYVKFPGARPIHILINPVSTNLKINISSITADAGNILIYDLHGKKMLQLNARAGSQDINVSAFPTGKFMLQLQAADGKIYNQAFIKQ